MISYIAKVCGNIFGGKLIRYEQQSNLKKYCRNAADQHFNCFKSTEGSSRYC